MLGVISISSKSYRKSRRRIIFVENIPIILIFDRHVRNIAAAEALKKIRLFLTGSAVNIAANEIDI